MKTPKLAVLGNPVAHSRSPEIHGLFGSQVGIELDYVKILVPDGKFRPVAEAFLVDGLGFNVTLPCKFEAFEFVSSASEAARTAQSVNTVSRAADGQLVGDNTDGAGLLADIVSNLGWQLQGKRLLVLGAGGAVSGVIGSLLDAAPASIDVYNRTLSKAEAVVRRWNDSRLHAVQFEELGEVYDLVINGTSAGLAGEDLQLPDQIIGAQSTCYDLTYGAGTTRFNQWALDRGTTNVADGLGMLVEQAALAFNIWFDVQPETHNVINELRKKIS
jgi:shikimate dehydrogenase